MLKILLKVLLINLLFTPFIYAIAPPFGLQWGMTQKQIEAQGMKILPAKKESTITQYVLQGVKGAPYPNNARYFITFDPYGKLNLISIKISLQKVNPSEEAGAIEKQLSDQYGNPTFISTGSKPSLGEYRYVNWGTPIDGYIAYTYSVAPEEVTIAYFGPENTK